MKTLIPCSADNEESKIFHITAQMCEITFVERPKNKQMKRRGCRTVENAKIEVHPPEMGYVHKTGSLKWVEGELQDFSVGMEADLPSGL